MKYRIKVIQQKDETIKYKPQINDGSKLTWLFWNFILIWAGCYLTRWNGLMKLIEPFFCFKAGEITETSLEDGDQFNTEQEAIDFLCEYLKQKQIEFDKEKKHIKEFEGKKTHKIRYIKQSEIKLPC